MELCCCNRLLQKLHWLFLDPGRILQIWHTLSANISVLYLRFPHLHRYTNSFCISHPWLHSFLFPEYFPTGFLCISLVSVNCGIRYCIALSHIKHFLLLSLTTCSAQAPQYPALHPLHFTVNSSTIAAHFAQFCFPNLPTKAF